MRLRCTCICTRTSTCNADLTRPDLTRPDPFSNSPLRDDNSFPCLNYRPRARAFRESAMEEMDDGMTTTQAPTRFVRVQRNIFPDRDRHPWLVFCDVCTDPSILGLFSKPLGWSRSWRIAQDYADRHVTEHRAAACPLCDHMKPLGESA